MPESPSSFVLPISLRWADLDPNGHVRHSVYYDWGAQVRITFLDREGVGLPWMVANNIGPVLFREEARFLKELRFGDPVQMDLELAAAAEDGRKWRMRHRLFRGEALAATLQVDGAWLDLRQRRIVTPPPDLVRAVAGLARTDDFTVLSSKAAAGT